MLVGDTRCEKLERLYHEAHRDLIRYLLIKLRSSDVHEAEDLAQECFLKIYNCDNFMTIENTRAFLFTIASNLLIDRSRKRARQEGHMQTIAPIQVDAGEESIPSGQASPERCSARSEELALVLAAVDDLPTNCRQALIMHRVAGMNHRQISEVLHVSVSMIEKYIADAMIRLHEAVP